MTKKIRLLGNTGFNSDGEIVNIVLETDGEVYYYDACSRYVYLFKKDEGVDFEYVEENPCP